MTAFITTRKQVITQTQVQYQNESGNKLVTLRNPNCRGCEKIVCSENGLIDGINRVQSNRKRDHKVKQHSIRGQAPSSLICLTGTPEWTAKEAPPLRKEWQA